MKNFILAICVVLLINLSASAEVFKAKTILPIDTEHPPEVVELTALSDISPLSMARPVMLLPNPCSIISGNSVNT